MSKIENFPIWKPEACITKVYKNTSLKSPTLEIKEKMGELIKAGKKVYKFGFGQSPFPAPDVLVKELQKQASKNSYVNIQGIPELRTEIAQFLKRRNMNYSADNIIISNGTKNALSDIIKVFNCEVLIPSPSWVSYKPMCIIAGRDYKIVKCKLENDFFPTANDIEDICQKDVTKRRLLIITTPNNPVGKMISKKRMKELVPVLRKYNVIVLTDEIYSELYEEGKEFQSFAMQKYYPEGTILTNGASKCVGAGGWRIGYAAFPKKLSFVIKYLRIVASNSYSCVCAPVQYASILIYKENEKIKKYYQRTRRILDVLRNYVYKRMIKIGIKMVKPDSSFYIFPIFSKFSEKLSKQYGVKSGPDFAKLLIEKTGVCALPGFAFNRDESEFSLRMALGSFNGKIALDNAILYEKQSKKLDDEYVKKNCAPVLEGIEKICKFLEKMDGKGLKEEVK